MCIATMARLTLIVSIPHPACTDVGDLMAIARGNEISCLSQGTGLLQHGRWIFRQRDMSQATETMTPATNAEFLAAIGIR